MLPRLHQFHWLASEDLIGDIPPRWNHLVDYDPPVANDELSLVHYTSGGPYFDDYKDCGYADLWFAERDRMTSVGRPAATPTAAQTHPTARNVRFRG